MPAYLLKSSHVCQPHNPLHPFSLSRRMSYCARSCTDFAQNYWSRHEWAWMEGILTVNGNVRDTMTYRNFFSSGICLFSTNLCHSVYFFWWSLEIREVPWPSGCWDLCCLFSSEECWGLGLCVDQTPQSIQTAGLPEPAQVSCKYYQGHIG
jgi:hypothetical protein